MTECENTTLRDLLPAYAHDALGAADKARVLAHLDTCAACAGELQVLMAADKLFAAHTPAIDLGRITAGVAAGVAAGTASTRPMLRVERSSRWSMPRYALAAAASLLIVASLAIPALVGTGGEADNPSRVAVDSGRIDQNAPVEILGASALGDLEVDELETLLKELEVMEATVSAEPGTIRAGVTEGI